jgi:hypothetical protein
MTNRIDDGDDFEEKLAGVEATHAELAAGQKRLGDMLTSLQEAFDALQHQSFLMDVERQKKKGADE